MERQNPFEEQQLFVVKFEYLQFDLNLLAFFFLALGYIYININSINIATDIYSVNCS